MNVITNIVPSALKSFSLLFLDNIKDVVATKNGINPDSQFLQVLNPATSVIASPATTQSESPISSGAVNLDFNWNGENLSYGVTASTVSKPNLVTVAVSSPTLTDWQTNWQRNFNLAFNAVPKSYRIPANLTDTNIQDTSENYAIVDTSVAAKNKLFLFLPGTSAQATYYQYIAREAAHLGYHVINLNYDNLDAVASLCLNNPDPNSYENVRLEALDGIDRTPLITVTPANSIQSRLIKMLQYMDVNNLGQGWGQYLPNGLPNWQKMVVAGHSQGGAEAAIIGKQHQVDRVVMFAPGDDYSAAINNLAPWISKPGATSADRYYGFKNTNDTATGLLSQTYQMWTMLGMDAYGSPLNVDGTRVNLTQSHEFITSLTSSNNSHNTPIVDNATFLQVNGTPVYSDVWQYLAASDTTTASGVTYNNQPSISGTSQNDTLVGSDFNDVISVGDGNDVITAQGGNDIIDGGNGDDQIISSPGGNTNESDIVNGGADHDFINGSDGGDILLGGDDSDTINGNGGNDQIEGGAGNDLLNAGDGNDFLVGGTEADTLTGGTGADQFVYNNPSESSDIITDFTVSQSDQIVVSAAGFKGGLFAGKPLRSSQLVLGRAANQGIAQFVYDSSTGRLLFDADGTGSGASTQIAILTTNPVLGTSSFTVIA